MTTRRFPPPWTVEQIPGGYKVKDANGQSLAYVYGRETRADADIAHVLTMEPRDRGFFKMSHKREWNLGPGSLFDCCGDLPSSSLVPPIWNPKSPGPPPRDRGFFLSGGRSVGGADRHARAAIKSLGDRPPSRAGALSLTPFEAAQDSQHKRLLR